MSRCIQIRSTIPPRTYGQGRKENSSFSALLRMSYLELERERRSREIEQLRARIGKLQARLGEIEQEKAGLAAMLEKAESIPLVTAAGAVAPGDADATVPAPARSAVHAALAIRY